MSLNALFAPEGPEVVCAVGTAERAAMVKSQGKVRSARSQRARQTRLQKSNKLLLIDEIEGAYEQSISFVTLIPRVCYLVRN